MANDEPQPWETTRFRLVSKELSRDEPVASKTPILVSFCDCDHPSLATSMSSSEGENFDFDNISDGSDSEGYAPAPKVSQRVSGTLQTRLISSCIRLPSLSQLPNQRPRQRKPNLPRQSLPREKRSRFWSTTMTTQRTVLWTWMQEEASQRTMSPHCPARTRGLQRRRPRPRRTRR